VETPSKEIFSVAGRIVVVTGGMGQLGRQFSMELCRRGASIVVLDQTIDREIATQRFGPLSERILFLEADVTERTSLEKALAVIESRFGVPHILINNAAVDSPPSAPASENGPFESYPESSWDKVISVNLMGAFLCSHVFGGAMAREGRGSIINISSIYGLVSPDQRIYEYRGKNGASFFKPVAYSVSKSGLLNFTRYLATYWAPKGVRVNAVTFAGVFNSQDEEFLKNYCNKVPLGRMAREDEYNGAILFLASDASSYMTGSNLIIDGGFTAW
jgi:NAD(P)-dependent dehydrogenase (short-subunit alcohol dehydrogenase family)